MAPGAIVQLDRLPLSPTGKLDRRALPAPAAGPPPGGAPPTPPADELEAQLVAIWENVLGVRPVGTGHNFFELGGHSLLAVRVIAGVEKRLDRRLSLAHFFQAPTIAQMAEALRQAGPAAPASATPGSPLVAVWPHGARRPFFWVHPAGGDLFSYAALARRLGPDRPLYMLQIPLPGEAQAAGAPAVPAANGHDGPPPATVEAIAAAFLRAIRLVQPAGPYLLGGWSSGATLAVEMAGQLLAAGERVALLASLDGPPMADLLGNRGPVDDLGLLAALAHQVAATAGLARAGLGVTAAGLRALPEPARLAFVVERLGAAGLPLDPAESGRLERAWRLLATYFRALASYRPRPYPGPMLIFRPAEATASAEMAALDGAALAAGPTLGWERHVAGPIEVHHVPGNHFTMLAEPNVAHLAAALQPYLAGL
jgi:thioesterase domain-containing protein